MSERAFATQPKASLPLSASRNNLVQRKLTIGSTNDPLEMEAGQVAADRTTSLSASSLPFGRLQREEAPKEKTNEEKYQEGLEKLGEAFLKTPLGKELLEKIRQDALVKGATELGKDFISTWQGKIVTGAAATGAVAALAATHKALPAQIPEIPLDVLTPGLSVQLTYKGPVDKPTEAMITFKFTEQAPKGRDDKKPMSATDKFRAETTRIAAENAKFRAGMTYEPGSPEDLQQKAEREGPILKYSGGPDIEATSKKYPWLATLQPKTGLQLTMPKPSFGIKPPALLGDVFKLKPPSEQKKKEDEPALQKKLSIGASNDPLEKEADRIADQVLAAPARPAASAAPVRIQRFTGQLNKGTDTAPASVDRVLASSGRPMEPALREDMEQRFGHDFSRVQVHSGGAAAQSAREVNANAYTVGRNVVFGAGRFAPGTHEGRRLIAHELTHVVQQSQGGGSALPINPRSDVVALPVTVAPPVLVKGVTAVGIARDPIPDSEDPLPGAFSNTSVTVATNMLPALTANELMERLVLAERGFQASPGGAPINTPKGQGSALGPGYKTYAGVQIIDKDGNQVISAIGQYAGGGKEHAEVNALRQVVAAVQRLGINLNGMRIMVVVDQTVCGGCTGALDMFATDTGITKMDVYLASREGVTPKTAGRTAAKVGAGAKLSFTKTFPPKPVGMNTANSELPNAAANKSPAFSGNADAERPRVRVGEQSPAANPSSPQVKQRIVDGRIVDIENIIGILGEEESPTSGNLEQAKPAAKKLTVPPVRTQSPSTKGSPPSTAKPAPPVVTSAQPAVKSAAQPLQAATPPPTSAKPSIKPTVPETPTPAVKPPTDEPSSIAPKTAAPELVAPAVKAPAVEPPSVVSPTGTAESAFAAGAKSFARAALRHIVSMAIFAAIDLGLRWVLSKIMQAQLKNDLDTIVMPQIEKKVEELAPKIDALQGSEKLYLNIGYQYDFTQAGSSDVVKSFMLGNPPSFYIQGSSRLKYVHPGHEEVHTDPWYKDEIIEKYLALNSELVKRTIIYSVLIDDPKKRAREKEQAELRERLNGIAKYQPKPTPPSNEPTQPTPLLSSPGQRAAPELNLLPGAPGEGPLEKAARWFKGAESVGWQLVTRGTTLEQRVFSNNSPSQDERNGFQCDEEQWRTAVKYQLNWSIDNAPDKAVQDLKQLLEDPSRPGPKLQQICSRLGGLCNRR